MVTGILSWKIVLKFCIHNNQLPSDDRHVTSKQVSMFLARILREDLSSRYCSSSAWAQNRYCKKIFKKHFQAQLGTYLGALKFSLNHCGILKANLKRKFVKLDLEIAKISRHFRGRLELTLHWNNNAKSFDLEWNFYNIDLEGFRMVVAKVTWL